jgi:hypothetical protein
MLDVMYEIPSQNGIRECILTENVINKKEKPILVYERHAESAFCHPEFISGSISALQRSFDTGSGGHTSRRSLTAIWNVATCTTALPG